MNYRPQHGIANPAVAERGMVIVFLAPLRVGFYSSGSCKDGTGRPAIPISPDSYLNGMLLRPPGMLSKHQKLLTQSSPYYRKAFLNRPGLRSSPSPGLGSIHIIFPASRKNCQLYSPVIKIIIFAHH